MRKLGFYFLALVMSFFLLANFSQRVEASSTTSKSAETAKSSQIVTEQILWNKLIVEAKKEDRIVVATSFSQDVKNAVTSAFGKKFGLNVEWIAGRPAELEAKIMMERTAGISAVDIALAGLPVFANTFKPMGITVPLEPLFILREITDKNKWTGGELPFYDKEKHGLQASLFATSFYIFNTGQVKAGELASTQDLLNPKWKGKIVMNDPRISGTANDWFTFTLIEILGREKGLQFMRDLVKQDPVITRDDRAFMEWVARGKYPIGIGPNQAVAVEFIKKGAEIAHAKLNEPRQLTQGHSLLCALNKPPHPNAQKLFVNWILSSEGSNILAQASGTASTRVDSSIEGILPILIPKDGDINVYKKYDYLSFKNEMMKKAKEIFIER